MKVYCKMVEFKKGKLGHITTSISRGITPSYTNNEGIYVVNQKCIRNGKISFDEIRISKEKLLSKEKIIEKTDTLICSTGVGTLGRVGRFNDFPENKIITADSHVTIVKADKKIVCPFYLSYVLISKQADIEGLAKGSTGQTELSKNELALLEIPLPPLDVQKRIAGILGALDDRIDVLRRENVVLEQMAQAVFQSWFVDFDIVRAKAAGTPESEVCEKYHITPELYALFPSALTPDNLPLGWEKKNLGDISQYSKEKTTNVNIETYVSTENMLPNYDGIEKASSVPETGQSTRYKAGNVLISNIRPYFKKIWFADREGSCSNDVLVFSSNSIGKCMLYSILAQDAFFDFVMSGANGDKMPRGNKKHIMTYPVIFPNMDLLNKFENLVASLFDKKSKNAQQIRALSATRDALLPQLLSGKIKNLR